MYALVAVVAFVAYPLGIPLFYYYQLRTNKEALHDKNHPEHEYVHGKLAFLYQDYVPEAWYWELVLLVQKFMLTGVLVFIKPDSTSQLAVGFAIAIIFFVLHVRTRAYCEIKEFDLQFYAALSILTTLFGGILLKTDTQNEDEYGEVALTSLLIACNMGIIVLFCYQIFITWKEQIFEKENAFQYTSSINILLCRSYTLFFLTTKYSFVFQQESSTTVVDVEPFVQTPSMGIVTVDVNSSDAAGSIHDPTTTATHFTPEQKEQGLTIFARYDLVQLVLARQP